MTADFARGFIRSPRFSDAFAANILIFAAIAKLLQAYFDTALLTVMLLCPIELCLGFLLLGGIGIKVARSVAFGAFLIFSAAAYQSWMDGLTDCGCFGGVSVPPFVTMIVDLIAACMMFAALLQPHCAMASFNRWMAVPAVAGLLALGVYSYHQHFLSGGISSPDEWVGRRVPILADIDNADALMRGRWTCLLANTSCDKCRTVVKSRLCDLEQNGILESRFSKYALIDASSAPFLDCPEGVQLFLASRSTPRLNLTIPYLIHLDAGVVVSASSIAF